MTKTIAELKIEAHSLKGRKLHIEADLARMKHDWMFKRIASPLAERMALETELKEIEADLFEVNGEILQAAAEGHEKRRRHILEILSEMLEKDGLSDYVVRAVSAAAA